MRFTGKSGIVTFDVDLKKKWTFMRGNSGMGKTYLLNCLLKAVPQIYGNKVVVVNCTNMNTDIVALAKQADLVCLDNADLYLTQELLEQLDSLDKFFLVAIHWTSGLALSEYDVARVVYEGSDIFLKISDRRERMYGKGSTLFGR